MLFVEFECKFVVVHIPSIPLFFSLRICYNLPLIVNINLRGQQMSFALIQKVNDAQKKNAVVDARSGDTVKVHQKIKEGNKERVQIFEGVVIRTDNKGQHTSRITVRKVASGIGVEKSFLL